jgi:EmrB/QacA subfamily drug resistance transporter
MPPLVAHRDPDAADARAKRLTLLATALGSGVAFLDQTVVNVALPSLRADLGATLAAQQWVVEAYLLTLGSLLLVGGSLGDVYGRRRVFAVGLAGFGATSLLCAVAPSTGTLIAARALQGAAGALLVPASLSIISAVFPPEERAAAIGSWTAWTGVAFIIGPLLGGALVDLVSWRLIFAINVPLVALNLWLLRAGVPESREAGPRRALDWPGAVLCALTLAGPVGALVEQPRRGWGDPLVVALLASGVVAAAAFLVQEARAREPMLPLGIFRSRNFAVGNVSTLAMYGGLGAATFFVTIYLQQVASYSATAAGLSLLPITLVMLALARRFGAVAARIGPRLLMGCGPLVSATALVWISRLSDEVAYATDLLPAVVVFGIGLSMTVAPLTATVLAAAPPEHAGVASGANNAISRVAALLAIAAVGALIAGRFGVELDDRVRADRLTSSERAAVARIRATPLAGRAEGAPRLDAAVRSASVSGFRTGMGAAALLMAAGGVISLIGIANPPRSRSA